jgi:tRNA(His) 5'-end guanylyltransferase
MQSEIRRKYQRRTVEAWRELLNEQAVSGLIIGGVLPQVSVNTASFYRWQGE